MPSSSSANPLGLVGTRESHVPVCLRSLRVDSIADFDIYIQLGPDEPFALYCERNLPFTDDARQRLIDNNVEQVYISAKQQREYGRYIENHLSEILEDDTIPVMEKSEILYTSAYAVVEDLLTTPDMEEGLQRTKEIVRHTVSSMFTNRIKLAHFLNVISFDYYIYTHSVNVTAYSVALAQRVGYTDPASLRELANGALVHDVGKSKIDPEILHWKGKLTQAQWDILKQHPRYGYEMLRDTNCLGEIALDIVLHHHEKLHGGGYPDDLKGDMISPFVRMVTISDIFDALTTERSFQRASSSFQALNLMRVEMAADLDPRLLRAFVSMMGPLGPAAEYEK